MDDDHSAPGGGGGADREAGSAFTTNTAAAAASSFSQYQPQSRKTWAPRDRVPGPDSGATAGAGTAGTRSRSYTPPPVGGRGQQGSNNDNDFDQELNALLSDMSDEDWTEGGRGDGGSAERRSGRRDEDLAESLAIAVPRMEDFASFDEYLDALVSQDKQLKGQKPVKKGQSSSSRDSAPKESLVDFLEEFPASGPPPPPAAPSTYRGAGKGESRDRYDPPSQQSKRASPRSNGGGNGAETGPAPRMEDFQSFEEYLDALVFHQKQPSPLSYVPRGRSEAPKPVDLDRLTDDDDDDVLGLLVGLDEGEGEEALYKGPAKPSAPAPRSGGFIVPPPGEKSQYTRSKPSGASAYSPPPSRPLPVVNASPASIPPVSSADTGAGDLDDFFNSLSDDLPDIFSSSFSACRDTPPPSPSRDSPAAPRTRVSPDKGSQSRARTEAEAAGDVSHEPALPKRSWQPRSFREPEDNTAAPASTAPVLASASSTTAASVPATATTSTTTAAMSAASAVPPQQQSSDLSARTVVELKEILKSRGLPVSGKKSELIDRISQSY